jgi:hypothetical protein
MKNRIPNPTGRNQYGEVGGQNDRQPQTAESIAAEHGVSERTVRRAGKFAAAVEVLKKTDPEIERRIVAVK